MTPEEIAEQQFNRARRGYDRDEVRSFLASVSAQFVETEARASLAAKGPEDTRPSDPFEGIGHDVTAVLRSAEEWATEVRAEAERDAAEIRSRAGADADETRAASTALKAEAYEVVEAAAIERSALDERLENDELRAAAESQERLDQAQTEKDRVIATAETEAESIRRNAEDDASTRSREILTASQTDLDRLLATQADVHSRLQSALSDAQSAVDTVSSQSELPPPPDIDLTMLEEPDSQADEAPGTPDTASDEDEPEPDDSSASEPVEDLESSTDDESSDRLAEVVRDAVSRALRERS